MPPSRNKAMLTTMRPPIIIQLILTWRQSPFSARGSLRLEARLDIAIGKSISPAINGIHSRAEFTQIRT
jgi:hypothetical protein